jgi:hypothetical protein
MAVVRDAGMYGVSRGHLTELELSAVEAGSLQVRGDKC